MSNLFQKASIITTPTAYDNGKLLSVKPAKTLGNELVTNGGFDTDSDWTLQSAWTISSGKAIYDNSANNSCSQSFNFVVGKKYQVNFEISDFTTDYRFDVYTGVSFIQSAIITSETSFSILFDGDGGNLLRFRGLARGTGFSLDNVSVKEVIDADFDFTRGSSATRVNEQGLIEDVQILSGNLVQNGDFSQIGSELVTNGDFNDGLNGWSSHSSSILELEDGRAKVTTVGGQGFIKRTDLSIQSGKIYFCTAQITNATIPQFFINGTSNSLNPMPLISGDTYGGYITTTGANSTFYIRGNNVDGQVSFIDNVSVKEVGQNWMPDEWIIDNDNGNQVMKFIGNAANKYLRQSDVYTPNDKIRLQFTLSNFTSGQFRAISTGVVWNTPTINATNGTFTYDIDTTGTSNGHIYFQAVGGSFNGYLDDVSVIKITEDTDLPRINYTNSEGSLLLEPQSTNLLPYSEDFSDSYWIKQSNITPTYNTTETLSPYGTYNATKLIGNGSDGILAQVSVTGVVSRSVYLKSVSDSAVVKLKDPVLTQTIKTITLNKSWQRYDLTESNLHSSLSGIWIDDIPSSGIYMWGAMLEQSSYPTSYIPTNGSTVTRLADVCNNAGSSDLINSTEGVLYAEIAALADDLTSRVISLSDGTANERVVLQFHNTTNRIRCFIKSGGSFYATLDKVVSDITDFHKIAYKYKSGETKLFVDGSLINSSSNTFSITGLNVLQFANGTPTALPLQGNVRSVAVFKEALTDTELTCLTS